MYASWTEYAWIVISIENSLTEATKDGVMEPEARWPGSPSRLHEADRPAVAVERLTGRERTPAQRGLPVNLGGGELDLAEDEVDHAVEELLLARNVVVERHRTGAELVRKLA